MIERQLKKSFNIAIVFVKLMLYIKLLILDYFALLSLAYGNVIDILDPEKKINQILQSDIAEQKKRYLIKQRISILENQKIIRNKLGANLHG